MGSKIGHRIDYNGVGALRGQRHIPAKMYLPPPPSPSVRALGQSCLLSVFIFWTDLDLSTVKPRSLYRHWGGIESIRINGVSVLIYKQVELRENVRAFFRHGQRKLSVIMTDCNLYLAFRYKWVCQQPVPKWWFMQRPREQICLRLSTRVRWGPLWGW